MFEQTFYSGQSKYDFVVENNIIKIDKKSLIHDVNNF